ncbi:MULTISPECIES: hypothetical protein [unclassified Mycobacterium]|uniref:hypothetical protein n=1 Tax=unclassified Mycobacterium TaxID=2642494 RepID=UPI0029C70752|nr:MULTISPECIES: hypothetical protein [unclassified Mycobacterium]
MSEELEVNGYSIYFESERFDPPIDADRWRHNVDVLISVLVAKSSAGPAQHGCRSPDGLGGAA